MPRPILRVYVHTPRYLDRSAYKHVHVIDACGDMCDMCIDMGTDMCIARRAARAKTCTCIHMSTMPL